MALPLFGEKALCGAVFAGTARSSPDGEEHLVGLPFLHKIEQIAL